MSISAQDSAERVQLAGKEFREAQEDVRAARRNLKHYDRWEQNDPAKREGLVNLLSQAQAALKEKDDVYMWMVKEYKRVGTDDGSVLQYLHEDERTRKGQNWVRR
ncbi:MAG: hypothetical protein WAL95_04915 [Candidatus Acidiferrales bacterium]